MKKSNTTSDTKFRLCKLLDELFANRERENAIYPELKEIRQQLMQETHEKLVP